MTRINKIRVVLFGILLLIGMISSLCIDISRVQRFYKSHFNGVVSDYRIDKRSGFVYINLAMEEKVLHLFDYLDNKNHNIVPGDSIFKSPKSVNIYVKRGDKVMDVSAPQNRDLHIIRRE